MRRNPLLSILVGIVLTAIGLFSAVALALAQPNRDDTVSALIAVQDEAGRPIPYITVWGFEEVDPKDSEYASSHLGAADLWRMTQRYGAQHEIISNYHYAKPVDGIDIFGMGGPEGTVLEDMRYADFVGNGKKYPRPDMWHFGFTFMKRGYWPGKVEFNVAKSEELVKATVTLKRNPAEAIETVAYIKTFELVRYHLSRFEHIAITAENKAKARKFAMDLEGAAQQAMAAGDKAAAARIYARMRFLPEIILELDGPVHMAGFRMSEAASPESKRVMDLALQLDPHNLYVWMETVHQQIKTPPGTPLDKWRLAYLEQLDNIIAQYGESAWPGVYKDRASLLVSMGNYVRAHELYLQAAQLEPKYGDWDRELGKLKAEMELKKVPIPEGW